jgi:uncharacterized protein
LGWRRFFRVVHRDAGYLAVGMTLLYVVSGVALNHLRDWNPNWSVSRRTVPLGLTPAPGVMGPADLNLLLTALGEGEVPAGVYQPDPGKVQLFFAGGRSVTVDLAGHTAEREVVSRRALLGALNALHLNRASRGWTWFADLYAVALLLLALTGLFLLRGRQGLAGRGAWLTAAGVALPLLVGWLTL